MASSPLRQLLVDCGLWVGPISEWVSAQGLETSDDLRCFFKLPDDAEAAGGTLLWLAWVKTVDSGPGDRCLLVLSARTEAWNNLPHQLWARVIGNDTTRPAFVLS